MSTFPSAAAQFADRQAQQPTYLQQYEQVQKIAGGQQEQQLNAQKLQQGQQSQADQQATTKALQAWDGKNINELPSLVLKNGGSANAVFATTQNLLDRQQNMSYIAKADAATNQNNLDTQIKQNDQYRGRIQSVIDAPANQKQDLWDKEITAEEQARGVQPGTVSHTYPGDDAASVIASHFGIGSQLAKEANEKQQTANAAWKPLNGQLVNTATGEKIGASFDVDSLNKALETRYQVLNPGKPLPPQFTLKPGASPEDFGRIDKILEATEKATGTKAQQETADAIRAQTFELSRDKSDMNAVIGTDPKTGNDVLVPMGQAQKMGIQNPMKADADMVNKSQAARHWLQLANGQGDPKGGPEDMGIMQLVDKLDAEGKLGPLASRWNDFLAGKYGAGDPDYAALRAKMGLSTTLLMQAHVGSRGGSALLEHFEDLANAGKMDGPTLKSSLGSEIAYVQQKAMDPEARNYRKPSSAASAPPAGATHTIKGSDGKTYWTDETGTKILGVKQ